VRKTVLVILLLLAAVTLLRVGAGTSRTEPQGAAVEAPARR